MDFGKNADRVNQELHDLQNSQSVMVSMADHVLDTKKRVEYGVHQILLEVGDLLKAQGTNINNTLNTRFDGISNDIMDNQNGALGNLTTKMEQEMNQVIDQLISQTKIKTILSKNYRLLNIFCFYRFGDKLTLCTNK